MQKDESEPFYLIMPSISKSSIGFDGIEVLNPLCINDLYSVESFLNNGKVVILNLNFRKMLWNFNRLSISGIHFKDRWADSKN